MTPKAPERQTNKVAPYSNDHLIRVTPDIDEHESNGGKDMYTIIEENMATLKSNELNFNY